MNTVPDALYFELDPGTILNPYYIDEVSKQRGASEEIHAIQLSKDHQLFVQGRFDGFRIYCIVTHPRPEIIPDSVNRMGANRFSAVVRLHLSNGMATDHEVVFQSPIEPLPNVAACRYAIYPDSFRSTGPSISPQAFICDLTFMSQYALNAPKIALKVEYIGIAKAEGREAYERLGEGHEKLQKLLAKQNSRPGPEVVSIILYRPNLNLAGYETADIIEMIEATMIQYFKPTPFNQRCLDFPNDSPALRKRILDRGIESIGTVVHAPDGTELFSQVVSAASQHVIRVDLKNDGR